MAENGKNGQPERLTFREFAERRNGPGGYHPINGEHYDAAFSRMLETCADFMDYLAATVKR